VAFYIIHKKDDLAERGAGRGIGKDREFEFLRSQKVPAVKFYATLGGVGTILYVLLQLRFCYFSPVLLV
jgi:hypothetical protein